MSLDRLLLRDRCMEFDGIKVINKWMDEIDYGIKYGLSKENLQFYIVELKHRYGPLLK